MTKNKIKAFSNLTKLKLKEIGDHSKSGIQAANKGVSHLLYRARSSSKAAKIRMLELYNDPNFEKSLDESLICLGMLNFKNYGNILHLREELIRKFGEVTPGNRNKRITKKLHYYREQFTVAVSAGAITGGALLPGPKGAAIGATTVTAIGLCSTVWIFTKNYRPVLGPTFDPNGLSPS